MTPKFLKTALVSACATLAVAGSASAAVLTFDLTGDSIADYNTLTSKIELTSDLLTIEVDAKRFRNLEVDADGVITSGSARDSRVGLFADGAGSLSSARDADSAVDGFHRNGTYTDFLQLRFSDRRGAAKVTITDLTFDRIAEGSRIANGDFFIVGDTNGSGRPRTGDQVSDILSASMDPVTLGPEHLNYGSIFAIGAGVDASWVLSSVTVDYTPVVPLPAGALLLMTGLAGLAMTRRARKRG